MHREWRRTGEDRKQTIMDLLWDNASEIESSYDELLEMHQEYRNEKEKQRTDAEQILTAKFWPEIYNQPKPREEVMTWLKKNGSSTLNHIFDNRVVPLQYLFARMEYVNASPKNLYWFVVFDDFWTLNHQVLLRPTYSSLPEIRLLEIWLLD